MFHLHVFATPIFDEVIHRVILNSVRKIKVGIISLYSFKLAFFIKKIVLQIMVISFVGGNMEVGCIGGTKYHIFKMFTLLAETVTLYSFCGHVQGSKFTVATVANATMFCHLLPGCSSGSKHLLLP